MLEKIGRSAPYYYTLVGLVLVVLFLLGFQLHLGIEPLKFFTQGSIAYTALWLAVAIPGLFLLGHLAAQLEIFVRNHTGLKYSPYSVYGACLVVLNQVEEGKEDLRQVARRLMSVPSELQGIYTEREESRELAQWIRHRDKFFAPQGGMAPASLDGWAQLFRLLFFCFLVAEVFILPQWLFFSEGLPEGAPYFLLIRLTLLLFCYLRAVHYSRLYVEAVLGEELRRRENAKEAPFAPGKK